jgi:phosphodiesterase/alkaline phosphatase D-like protein
MHRVLLQILLLLETTAIAGVLFSSDLLHAQPASRAEISASTRPRVHIREGPALESVKDNVAIIKWTSNNPGGTDEHFGLVHYGTDPDHLTEVAKSHIRLNPGHTSTVFRVRIDGLKPQTTYYYTVDSAQGNGTSDGVKSRLTRFTTP